MQRSETKELLAHGSYWEDAKGLPYLITTRPRHVPHPLDTAVLTLLKHLEVSDNKPELVNMSREKFKLNGGLLQAFWLVMEVS